MNLKTNPKKTNLKVECFIAIEHNNKSAKLITKCFDWLGFTSTSRTEWRTTKSGLKCLCHCQIASIGERCLHEFVLNAEVFEAVEEFRVGHLNCQLIQLICLLWIEVKAHLGKPFEALRWRDSLLNQCAQNVSLMHVLDDEMFEFATSNYALIVKYRVGQEFQCVFHIGQGGAQRVLLVVFG